MQDPNHHNLIAGLQRILENPSPLTLELVDLSTSLLQHLRKLLVLLPALLQRLLALTRQHVLVFGRRHLAPQVTGLPALALARQPEGRATQQRAQEQARQEDRVERHPELERQRPEDDLDDAAIVDREHDDDDDAHQGEQQANELEAYAYAELLKDPFFKGDDPYDDISEDEERACKAARYPYMDARRPDVRHGVDEFKACSAVAAALLRSARSARALLRSMPTAYACVAHRLDSLPPP